MSVSANGTTTSAFRNLAYPWTSAGERSTFTVQVKMDPL
jgi:hypothetical protein